MPRRYTNKLDELIDEGLLTRESVLSEMLCYFSEDQIKGFCIDGFAGELEEYFKELD